MGNVLHSSTAVACGSSLWAPRQTCFLWQITCSEIETFLEGLWCTGLLVSWLSTDSGFSAYFLMYTCMRALEVHPACLRLVI